MWAGFFLLVIATLFIDLFLLGGKKSHRVSTAEALTWVIIWICLALIFNLLLWWYLMQTEGHAVANQKALEFFTGYTIEKTLSVDNMFIFVVLFRYFAVPAEYQRRVLIFGMFSAVVMRLIMILLGVWIIAKFHWILYLFGAFLIITGIKMLLMSHQQPNLDSNPLLKWLLKYLRVTKEYHGEKFLVLRNHLWYVTPLFITLILIEVTDLVFAVDSIPAIFAVTQDPFIIFTSNIFAILGLRALYFLLANMMEKFHFLKYGIALILVFAGFKMVIAPWFKIPILIALSVIVIILAGCIVLSMSKKITISKR